MPDFDFTKAGTVTNLDDVPENYRGLYVEGETDDGEKVHRLDERVNPLIETLINTNKSLAQAKADKTAASNEAASRRVTKKSVVDFISGLGVENINDDEPLEALNAYILELTDQVKGGKELKIDIGKIKAESEKRIGEATAAEQQKTARMQSTLERYLVDQSATAAIAEAKGSLDLLLPIVKSATRVVQDGEDFVPRIVDAQGDIRYDGTGNPMSISAYVADLKRDEKYARAFESEVLSGGGVKPGATNTRLPVKDGAEISAAQKISQGIAKGEHRTGVRTG